MVSALSEKARKGFVVPRSSNTEWLVLHFRAGRTWFAAAPSIVEPESKKKKCGNEGDKAQTGTRKRVLIIVEIGMGTEPFCGSAHLVTASNAPETTERLDDGVVVSLG
ncbi:hypothetical protein GUITHDRAFT_120099 [Guillardia theta CCMP2712]|uniref:Uncharacterized protein n=1 Tax=Guillardia theta (strain CCMP2712) TaxID=905079 RepID=L1ICZ5_GUITC|nr:hypothetical protein GUITHDRAFT_120099 [Guillardia theta CCMP2712]EKX33710.1 hypothetical protein GUITHDRAFT_120099 [Guillardia theta CCMP2712]|eukprot:XP_005820690.1 hypothetical protein GUITHDRAFT_120099 [Guillardia theta CCMP2712]